jgi:hypothetical protein
VSGWTLAVFILILIAVLAIGFSLARRALLVVIGGLGFVLWMIWFFSAVPTFP